MIKLIVKLVFFLVMAQAYAQSGTVRIEVRTNVNKFTCSCDEESFVCKEFDANQKVLKLPVASFSCPKRMIEKDLVELFEAEKYPYISIEILDYKNFKFRQIHIFNIELASVYAIILL